MSGWLIGLFMIMSQINPASAPPQSQPRSASTILPTAPPPPHRLLPAARLGRFAGVALPAPNFERAPFEARVELPLAQFWGGRLTISGFHSEVSYSSASLGDPYFRRLQTAPGSAGASRSYGIRITISSQSSSSSARAENQPR